MMWTAFALVLPFVSGLVIGYLLCRSRHKPDPWRNDE